MLGQLAAHSASEQISLVTWATCLLHALPLSRFSQLVGTLRKISAVGGPA